MRVTIRNGHDVWEGERIAGRFTSEPPPVDLREALDIDTHGGRVLGWEDLSLATIDPDELFYEHGGDDEDQWTEWRLITTEPNRWHADGKPLGVLSTDDGLALVPATQPTVRASFGLGIGGSYNSVEVAQIGRFAVARLYPESEPAYTLAARGKAEQELAWAFEELLTERVFLDGGYSLDATVTVPAARVDWVRSWLTSAFRTSLHHSRFTVNGDHVDGATLATSELREHVTRDPEVVQLVDAIVQCLDAEVAVAELISAVQVARQRWE